MQSALLHQHVNWLNEAIVMSMTKLLTVTLKSRWSALSDQALFINKETLIRY